MLHAAMEWVTSLLCLVTGIVGFRKHDRRSGVVFSCNAIGLFAMALERALPARPPWLGDIGAGVLLAGSAWLVASLWRARRRHRSTDAG